MSSSASPSPKCPVFPFLIFTAAVAVVNFSFKLSFNLKEKHISSRKPRPTFCSSSRSSTNTTNTNNAIKDTIVHRRSTFPKQHVTPPLPISKEVIDHLLSFCQWAPNHKISEPWRFKVFADARKGELANFLASSYKQSYDRDVASFNKTYLNADGNYLEPNRCPPVPPAPTFSQKKHDAKIQNCNKCSHVVAVVLKASGRAPVIEDLISVAMGVQNVHLAATAEVLGVDAEGGEVNVGLYWSSAGVFDNTWSESEKGGSSSLSGPLPGSLLSNPSEMRAFLDLARDEVCLGWLFIGSVKRGDCYRAGRRSGMSDKVDWGSR